MTLYIYKNETREVVAEIHGSDNRICEDVAAERFGDTDTFGWTYTPAFGAVDGLVKTANVEQIKAS